MKRPQNRRCIGCGKILTRRQVEQSSNFKNRKFCGFSCRRLLVKPAGKCVRCGGAVISKKGKWIGGRDGKHCSRACAFVMTEKALRESQQNSPLSGPFETNVHANHWRLRSPSNILFEFKNLRFFIRENSRLFAPQDVVWRKYGGSPATSCPANQGLASLSIHREKPAGSWKGWTWFSQTERLFNGGDDLLRRDSTKLNFTARTAMEFGPTSLADIKLPPSALRLPPSAFQP